MQLYDIKIYDENGREKETVRKLTYSQKVQLEAVLKRNNIEFYAKEYDNSRRD